MMRRTFMLALALSVGSAGAAESAFASERASLKGSAASMAEQNRVAKDHGLSFFRTEADIRAAAARGDLVELTGNDDYEVASFVSLPYSVPAVRTFVEDLSRGYREACGQKLVVTSATRASSKQPKNAHNLSVHPAGMALDLRVSDRASCRQWLEATLMSHERAGLLNGIREFHPPHYHVAIYPASYMAYSDQLRAELHAEDAALAEAAAEEQDAEGHLPTAPEWYAAYGMGGATTDAPERSGGTRVALSLSTALMLTMGGWFASGLRGPGRASGPGGALRAMGAHFSGLRRTLRKERR